jgi:hypothetical protein
VFLLISGPIPDIYIILPIIDKYGCTDYIDLAHETSAFVFQDLNPGQTGPILNILDTEIDLLEVANNSFIADNVPAILTSPFHQQCVPEVCLVSILQRINLLIIKVNICNLIATCTK